MTFLVWIYNVITWFMILAFAGFSIRAIGFHFIYVQTRRAYKQNVGPQTFDVMRKYWNLRFWNIQSAALMFGGFTMLACLDAEGHLFPNLIWLTK